MRISASELNGTPLRARALLGLTPCHVCGGTWAHPCHDSGSPLGQFPRPRPPSGTGTALAQVKQTNRAHQQTNNARAPDVAKGVHEAAVPLVVAREAPDRRHLRARARLCLRVCEGALVRFFRSGPVGARVRARCAVCVPAARSRRSCVRVCLRFACVFVCLLVRYVHLVSVCLFVCLFVALFVCLLGRPLLANLAYPACQPVDSGDASIRRLCV